MTRHVTTPDDHGRETPSARSVSPDLYIGNEPYDVLDDIKALRHVPCGEVLFGDGAIADHVCEEPS